jgi:hypothetical protein
MKKLLLALFLVLNVYALGGIDALPKNEKNIALAIKNTLGLNSNQAYKIFTDYVQVYLNSPNWHVHYQDNTDPANAKIKNTDHKAMFMNILNDSRIINISFIKYPKKHQMLIYVTETLPRSQSLVLEKYNDLEKDSKFKKSVDTTHFASFKKPGYMSHVNIYTNGTAGAIQYEDLYIEDLD